MNDDFNSYTVFASVDLVQSDDGNKYFGNGKLNHLLEITGIHSGKIDFWSYGKNFTTSKNNCSVGELLILKKTNYGKSEKAAKKFLSCNCNVCSMGGRDCSDCVGM